MTMPDNHRNLDVRAGLSLYVGRPLPAEFLGLPPDLEPLVGSWVYPEVTADPLMTTEPAEQRLSVLGRQLRERGTAAGMTMLAPGSPGWPAGTGCDGLPCLWVRGAADVAEMLDKAITMTGSRACTTYGAHVAEDVSGQLTDAGWTIVTAAGLGIDHAAIGGALAVPAASPLLVAGAGLDQGLGPSTAWAVEQTSACGAVISPFPPGANRSLPRSAVRSHLLYRLGAATALVEASMHSESLPVARRAAQAGWTVCAMPGPVTSVTSAGCHQLIREGVAVPVTSAEEIAAATSRTGGAGPDRFTISAEVRHNSDPCIRVVPPFQVIAASPAYAANAAVDIIAGGQLGSAELHLLIRPATGADESLTIRLAAA
ncbi:DNA-processing protein DprA [Actinoplanes sp. NPDC000266]